MLMFMRNLSEVAWSRISVVSQCFPVSPWMLRSTQMSMLRQIIPHTPKDVKSSLPTLWGLPGRAELAQASPGDRSEDRLVT